MSRRMHCEATIHMRLRHPNIVSMIGVVLETEKQGFVLEYVKFGALDQFLRNFAIVEGL